MLCLSELRDMMYGDDDPLLPGMAAPKELAFFELFLPEEFYSRSHNCDGKDRNLEKVIIGESQRNKVFSGKYTGLKLRECTLDILKAFPNYWEAICSRCNGILNSMTERNRARMPELLLREAKSSKCNVYAAYMTRAVVQDLPTAFASLVISAMVQTELERFVPIFAGTVALSEQFAYLNRPADMMKQSFGDILDIPTFTGELKRVYGDYEKLMGCLCRVTEDGKPRDFGKNLLDTLYRMVCAANCQKVLCVTGPGGSEKNAITQLLYIRLCCDVRTGAEAALAPFFVDLQYYRRMDQLTREERVEILKKDLQVFFEFCEKQSLRTPILFVDGLKDFSLSADDTLDFTLEDLVRDRLPNTRFVISRESNSLGRTKGAELAAAFATGAYRVHVTLEPLYLLDEANAKVYLEEFGKIYHSPVKDLYATLRSLGMDRVDTYQLRLLLPLLDGAGDIAELYLRATHRFLGGDTRQLQEAGQWAYHFAYTDKRMDELSFRLSGRMQELLLAHESFLEYFIARWYMTQVRSGDRNTSVETLNMIMPKGVTRFIVAIMNRAVPDQRRILELARSSYEQMSSLAKAEMCYWLCRIESPALAEEAELLLRQYYGTQCVTVRDSTYTAEPSRKRDLFLLRCSAAGLISKGDRRVSREYIRRLMFDPMSNEINRGFHLEYYGDRPYQPAYRSQSYRDDVTVGKRTLDHLLADIRYCIENRELSGSFDLDLFTICSLLQARIERANPNITFEVRPYVEKAAQYARWYCESGNCGDTTLEDYLHMIVVDFEDLLLHPKAIPNSIPAKVYSTYARRVLRTGWVDHKIPNPETVAEHSFHAWQMGMFHLPEAMENEPNYCKSKVLELILAHDMAEAVIGDISRAESRNNPEKYRQEEMREMRTMLMRCTYPSMPVQRDRYDLWLRFYDPGDINGRIARELDLIQTMYCLLTYYTGNIGDFEADDVKRWMKDRFEVATPAGCAILRTLVLDNEVFAEALQKLGIFSIRR